MEKKRLKEEIQRDFPALGFLVTKTVFQGQKASEMNQACVSGLNWIFTLLTNISELAFTYTVVL